MFNHNIIKMQPSQLFRDSLILLGGKRTMLEKDRDAVDTIAIGSSHGDFGFDPSHFPKSFNLCSRSQDLKHSCFLHERISEKYKKIKNVIVFYSVFSPGSFLEKAPSECEIAPVLNEIFDLQIKYKDEKLNALAASIRGKLDDLSVDIDGIRGFFPKSGKSFLSVAAETRVASHLRFNKVADANVYLTRILKLARKLKQRVCIVIPPVRSDYRAVAGSDSAVLFKPLFDVLKNHSSSSDVVVLDCFNDERFEDSMFGDTDHLLPLGAGPEVLTKLVFETLFPQKSSGRTQVKA